MLDAKPVSHFTPCPRDSPYSRQQYYEACHKSKREGNPTNRYGVLSRHLPAISHPHAPSIDSLLHTSRCTTSAASASSSPHLSTLYCCRIGSCAMPGVFGVAGAGQTVVRALR
ncbi:hypothetical protein PsYK624_160940 [Phanerochaete sordida]|uniref:Uncharacterized protein n=1 Tax=Phanerochaete sordida TaxID=48140 RepID=A0A9P3LN07_9APHY|nr:hypothetical protein PsYK624_160940 [Phanerochaete sordida]